MTDEKNHNSESEKDKPKETPSLPGMEDKGIEDRSNLETQPLHAINPAEIDDMPPSLPGATTPTERSQMETQPLRAFGEEENPSLPDLDDPQDRSEMDTQPMFAVQNPKKKNQKNRPSSSQMVQLIVHLRPDQYVFIESMVEKILKNQANPGEKPLSMNNVLSTFIDFFKEVPINCNNITSEGELLAQLKKHFSR